MAGLVDCFHKGRGVSEIDWRIYNWELHLVIVNAAWRDGLDGKLGWKV